MKKFLAILMVAVMLLGLLAGCGKKPSTDNAQTTGATEPPRQVAQTASHKAAESFAGGTGTEADPFQISEAGHLVLLQQMLKKEKEEINFDDTYVKGHFVLTADISLNDAASFANWATTAPEYGWEPIGFDAKEFAGVLDGKGHKITGMFIDADGSANAVSLDYYGLFAKLNGTVKNLTMEKSYIRVSGSTTSAGTIAGGSFEGKIENCTADTVIDLYDTVDAGGIIGNGGSITGCSFSGKITQLDDGFANIGGMVGYDDAVIENCTFTGTLSGKGHTGGIVGFGGNVKNSVNKGTVTGANAGGIVGRVYEAGTGLEIKQPTRTIDGCINEGTVTGTAAAGGIVGSLGNGESDISMSVVNCQNKGQVHCDEYVAGIIGDLAVDRSGLIKVDNCVNHVDISGKNSVAGIVGKLAGGINHQEGSVVISNCQNLGKLDSEGAYAAGVVAYYMLMGKKLNHQLTIENCTNSGAIQCQNSAGAAGGIMGFSNVGFNASVSADSMEISDDTRISLRGCKNSGSVTATTSNSRVGGIVGSWGAGFIPADITNCVNTGAVTVDFTLTDEQIKEGQGAAWTEFYQIAGGIVGRIGDGLKLTTAEAGERNPANVNSADAKLVITGCSSTGAITAPDYSSILNKAGKPLYVNYLGGVVGQCSATEGYAFRVENCTYSGADRGLGDTNFADLGTKQ